MSRREKQYLAISIASFSSSIIGLGIGAWITKPVDGQRGGGIAVALALLALFIRNDYGSKVQKALAEEPETQKAREDLLAGHDVGPVSETVKLRAEIAGLMARIDSDTRQLSKQNSWYVIGTSLFGTVVWAFGDIFSCLLKKYLPL